MSKINNIDVSYYTVKGVFLTILVNVNTQFTIIYEFLYYFEL